MTVIFMDGFDYYLTADLPKRYTSSALATIGPTYGRQPTGQGVLIGSSNVAPLLKTFGTNYTEGIVGFAWYLSTSTASKVLCTITDGTTEQISVRTNASSVPTVQRTTNVLATGTTVLSQNTWYYFELKFTINNTTGVVELHLNGSTEISSTSSLNTRNTSNTQWNGFQFGIQNSGTGTCQVDDIYVINTAASPNQGFLGPVRVVSLYPSEAGNYSQWTPNGGSNMGSVSEPYQDGDTSFNQSNTANQIDSFKMTDLPTGSGSVHAVQHVITARQDSGAARTIAPVVRTGGSDYVGTTQSLTTSYQFLTEIKDQNPGTSSAWSISDVNGAEFGYKLIS